MTRALIITRDSETKSELRKSLAKHDITCPLIADNNDIREAITSTKPDVLLLELDEQRPGAETQELIGRIKKSGSLPIITLIPGEMLDRTDLNLDIDDFITGPYDAKELIIRINRVLHKRVNSESHEQVKCDGLTIDLATCEVTVNGKIVELTFKEYELLKLLASNKGRVYTRETLLDKIWGYDYYGGDRTVDVHIRRLRSKIEDASHTYIETVRNIGYRFIKQS